MTRPQNPASRTSWVSPGSRFRRSVASTATGTASKPARVTATAVLRSLASGNSRLETNKVDVGTYEVMARARGKSPRSGLATFRYATAPRV